MIKERERRGSDYKIGSLIEVPTHLRDHRSKTMYSYDRPHLGDFDGTLLPAQHVERHAPYNYNDRECTCNISSILAIDKCKLHNQKTGGTVRMPNLVKNEKDCVVLKQGWVKKKTTKFLLGF